MNINYFNFTIEKIILNPKTIRYKKVSRNTSFPQFRVSFDLRYFVNLLFQKKCFKIILYYAAFKKNLMCLCDNYWCN